MTLAELNAYPREQFVEAIGWVFEHSPWVAARAWRHRPFASFDDLSTRLIQEVQAAPPDEQLALLRASSSLAIQPGEHSKLLLQLNEEYRKKFGFPFVFAVKSSDAAATAEALKRRLKSSPDQEFQVALGNIFRMARFRLEDVIQ